MYILHRQRVYGVTWAVVKVGFAYSNCDQIIWDAQTTQVSGHDMSISDIGGWDLSIHHRYNFHEGESLQYLFYVEVLISSKHLPVQT